MLSKILNLCVYLNPSKEQKCFDFINNELFNVLFHIKDSFLSTNLFIVFIIFICCLIISIFIFKHFLTTKN